MAAGCLPVLMAQTEDILPNLPFPHAINWPETVLFGGGLSCALKQKPEATTRGTTPTLTLTLTLTHTLTLTLTHHSPKLSLTLTLTLTLTRRPPAGCRRCSGPRTKRLQCMARRAQRTFLRYLPTCATWASCLPSCTRSRFGLGVGVGLGLGSGYVACSLPQPLPNPIQPVPPNPNQHDAHRQQLLSSSSP